MTIADSAAPRFQVGRVFKRTFNAIANNFPAFALMSVVTAIPSAALTWLEPEFFSGFDPTIVGLYGLAWLAYLISAFALQAAVVHGTVADLNGSRASLIDCLSTGFRHFLPLIPIALVYAVWVGVGLLLFVVPGIVFAVMMSVAVPVRVVERTRVLVAFDRSQDLTSGYRWPIFGVFLAYFVAQTVLSATALSIVGFGFPSGPLLDGAASGVSPNAWPVILASTVASMINSVLSAAGTAAIYSELRQIKESVGPEALAAVFD